MCTIRARTIVNKSGIIKMKMLRKKNKIDKAINIILQHDLKNLVIY